MTLFKNKYRIESNRWQMWDYSLPASYFITLCVHDTEIILGRIESGKMYLSETGKIVAEHLVKITDYNRRLILDEWIVMPNHVHFIITLAGYNFDNAHCDEKFYVTTNGLGAVEKIHEFSLRLPYLHLAHNPSTEMLQEYRKKRRHMLIPMVMGKFKMQTSKKINSLNNTRGMKTWQQDYHDHVIRSKNEYWHIRKYIKNNPSKWEDDRFHV